MKWIFSLMLALVFSTACTADNARHLNNASNPVEEPVEQNTDNTTRVINQVHVPATDDGYIYDYDYYQNYGYGYLDDDFADDWYYDYYDYFSDPEFVYDYDWIENEYEWQEDDILFDDDLDDDIVE